MCMCTYFLFQCIDVCTYMCVVSKCFYTEPFPPLLLSFSPSRSMSDNYQWWPVNREREEGERKERERGYTFCVILFFFSEEKKTRRLSICSTNSREEREKQKTNYIEVHWNKWVARFVRDQNGHLNLFSSSVSTMIYVLWTVIVLTEHTHVHIHTHTMSDVIFLSLLLHAHWP